MVKALNLTGQRFGRVVVIDRSTSKPRGATWWNCKCDCGNTKVLRGSLLVSGNTRSCGCLEAENRTNNVTKHKAKAEDYLGKKFGRITITRVYTERQKVRVHGSCDCGNTWKGVLTTLIKGRIQSCGCLIGESTKARFTKHGQTVGGLTREYKAWQAMMRRCYDEQHKDYEHYRSRGITVCEEWRNDAGRFVSDMGECPEGYTLDRIDNDGPYASWNCRWATRLTQSRNSSQVKLLTFNGMTKPMSQWAEELGLSYYVLRTRIHNLGWDVARALTEPVRKFTAGGPRKERTKVTKSQGTIKVRWRRDG